MQKKYYRNDGMGAFAPNAGVPMHAPLHTHKNSIGDGQIITPYPVNKEDESKKQTGLSFGSLFKNNKILGRYEADDIMLLCIVFLLLQNKDDLDIPLLLALGYIFFSDKDLSIF